jgi:hypothetical protein
MLKSYDATNIQNVKDQLVEKELLLRRLGF